MSLQFVDILGIQISAINMPQALAEITKWIEGGKRQYVSVCTVHTVVECQFDPLMRLAVNGAGMKTPDGMPLVWLSRWKSHESVSRVYGPDLMLAICENSAAKGYTQYFYGGASGVPEELSATLCELYPGLKVAGAYSPPFHPLSEQEKNEIVDAINLANPDIVWVGLGTPKQDLWMLEYRSALTARVLIGIGAAFDFHTGRVPQAPSWMQKSGLEWLFRLLQEPRRLWRRYLLYNPYFIFLLFLQGLGLHRHKSGD